LILFDVWHHLQYPGEALREFSRVLAPGGKVLIFEPAMGVLGKSILGRFHHEPLGLEHEIQWDAPVGFCRGNPQYYAAQGNASRIFGSSEFSGKLEGWQIAEIRYYSGLAYLGTGGFRGPQTYPPSFFAFFNLIDKVISRFPQLASRMLVLLEKVNHRLNPMPLGAL